MAISKTLFIDEELPSGEVLIRISSYTDRGLGASGTTGKALSVVLLTSVGSTTAGGGGAGRRDPSGDEGSTLGAGTDGGGPAGGGRRRDLFANLVLLECEYLLPSVKI